MKQHTRKKSFSNTTTVYLEDDDHKEVNFKGKTLSFIIQLIQI